MRYRTDPTRLQRHPSHKPLQAVQNGYFLENQMVERRHYGTGFFAKRDETLQAIAIIGAVMLLRPASVITETS